MTSRPDWFTKESFLQMLPGLCRKDTAAADGKGWTPENPTWGHCAAASLIAQKLFGGDLMRVSLVGTEFAESSSHYFNRLPDGTLFDATEAQFGGRLRTAELAESRGRESVIRGADTRQRYATLAYRFAKELLGGHGLFDDPLYEWCLTKAFTSPCQKAGFGAMVMRGATRQAWAVNEPIEALADLCDPECCRLAIRSRTESMLGACGHAEEWAMKLARDGGANLTKCELYVAGTGQDGLPAFKTTVEFTCLRCAVAMHMNGIRTVYVPMRLQWMGLTTEQCLKSAKAYATGQKKLQ